MKLSDLEGTFILSTDKGFQRVGSAPAAANGLLLMSCPDPRCSHAVVVWFANPIGSAAVAPANCVPTPRWQRTGETLETLTLNPSVNIHGCWHGWIRNGEAH